MTASLTDTSDAGWFTAAVAAELRAHMARQRVSGREVARRLHVSAQWMSLRTKGASPLSTDEIERICDVLGISPQQLLAGAFTSANSPAIRAANPGKPIVSDGVVLPFPEVKARGTKAVRSAVVRTREVTGIAS